MFFGTDKRTRGCTGRVATTKKKDPRGSFSCSCCRSCCCTSSTWSACFCLRRTSRRRPGRKGPRPQTLAVPVRHLSYAWVLARSPAPSVSNGGGGARRVGACMTCVGVGVRVSCMRASRRSLLPRRARRPSRDRPASRDGVGSPEGKLPCRSRRQGPGVAPGGMSPVRHDPFAARRYVYGRASSVRSGVSKERRSGYGDPFVQKKGTTARQKKAAAPGLLHYTSA